MAVSLLKLYNLVSSVHELEKQLSLWRTLSTNNCYRIESMRQTWLRPTVLHDFILSLELKESQIVPEHFSTYSVQYDRSFNLCSSIMK